MKKISVLILFLILFTSAGQTQELNSKQNLDQAYQVDSINSVENIKNKYSQNNLEHLSLKDLNQYLRRARNQRTAGLIISLAGSTAFVSGAMLGIDATIETFAGSIEGNTSEGTEDKFSNGALLIVGGAATTIAGSILVLIGNSRVKHIKKAIYSSTGANLNLAPNLVYDNLTRNTYSGVSLRIRF